MINKRCCETCKNIPCQILDRVPCSRPHPAPSDCKEQCTAWVHDVCDKRVAEAARKAREDVLSLLEEWDYHNNRNFGKPHPVFADMVRLVREKPDEIRKHLESLRRTTPKSEVKQ